MSPLWGIRYTDEVKFYFIDSGDYTGNLLGEIELLRYNQSGLPPDKWEEIEPGLILWRVLDHLVYYRRRAGVIMVAVVKPK